MIPLPPSLVAAIAERERLQELIGRVNGNDRAKVKAAFDTAVTLEKKERATWAIEFPKLEAERVAKHKAEAADPEGTLAKRKKLAKTTGAAVQRDQAVIVEVEQLAAANSAHLAGLQQQAAERRMRRDACSPGSPERKALTAEIVQLTAEIEDAIGVCADDKRKAKVARDTLAISLAADRAARAEVRHWTAVIASRRFKAKVVAFLDDAIAEQIEIDNNAGEAASLGHRAVPLFGQRTLGDELKLWAEDPELKARAARVTGALGKGAAEVLAAAKGSAAR